MIEPVKLMTLQTRAAEAEALRVNLVEAKLKLETARKLMIQMDRKYKAMKGTERRLLQRQEHNRKLAVDITDSWYWFFLPAAVKSLVWAVLDA